MKKLEFIKITPSNNFYSIIFINKIIHKWLIKLKKNYLDNTDDQKKVVNSLVT